MLKDKITSDMREAMKARDQIRVATLRLLVSSITNVEKEKIKELSDDEVLEVVAREAKRRRESIDAFRQGGRDDLVDRETAELAVLEGYLPEKLSQDELATLVDQAIAETGASSPKQMGEVMKALMPKIRGRADGAQVSGLVKSKLGA